MFDFVKISERRPKQGILEIYPKFIIKKPVDLMIRGGDFYAIWMEKKGLWSTDEQEFFDELDRELTVYASDKRKQSEETVKVLYMWDPDSGMVEKWHKYCQKLMRDSFHPLDEKLIFANTETKKQDYASKRLSYPLEEGDISAYDKLMSTLYSEEERHKIEWAIGAVVTGESKSIQKFLVLYGPGGTGKSTVLNIIEKLFDGYYSVFDAKSLGSSTNAFALEAFKNNPLVAIQHDGDLSRIEDNTRLNSVVSHELMTVNEKYRPTYPGRFNCFLFMGTNKPVKITDAKSGLIRRLIDVSPTGEKLSEKEYFKTTKQIDFELGAIAKYCKDVYLQDPNRYNNYIPVEMFGASNDFYNYMLDSYYIFKKADGTTLKAAWEMYKAYCDEAKVGYPFSQRVFKEELKNYFKEYKERYTLEDGTRVRSYYSGFKTDKFENNLDDDTSDDSSIYIQFKAQKSVFDEECANCPAQYATDKETPSKKWENVNTTLSDLDTSKLHYVKVPENHIVIDFDIPDKDGNKCFEKNLEEASKWPPTYAELSKSEAGIHLHYIYTGDVSKLSRVFGDHIEIKVFSGNGSLRRKLTKCNDLPIATLSSGLPLKGEAVVKQDIIKSEKGLRNLIARNLNKEIHPGTKPSIEFIYKILEDAYNSDLCYDVGDMRNSILSFAMKSTHHAQYCVELVNKMKFKSEEHDEGTDTEGPLIFYDIEVFPNLFLVNWKKQGADNPVVRMINPSPIDIENLIKFRLIGFNCRRYDNHIMYARLMGYTNEQLYKLSKRIISGDTNCFFGEAYNLSYTDVYDFASAGNKKSLKKLEIEMGIHHQELGLPWDEPVPEDMFLKVAEYCDNDVIATEAAFNYLKADWTARQILADLAGMSVNDTTNSLTTRIIFGTNRKPQDQFLYRDLSKPVHELDTFTRQFLTEACPEMMAETLGPEKSLLPYFSGYKYENGVSTYRGEEVGEGGNVYAEPGIYENVALLDISSMHPHSAIAEALFGVRYTKIFRELVEARVHIKHEEWDIVKKMLDGLLKPYIQKVKNGEMTAKDLANALKTAINSVYGLTAANFDNPFRDIRNKDNIVAKRGALFMIDLKHEVQKRGFTVAHIKTDSIKIPNATPEIIDFVMKFGKRYGYTFEHEATYEKMCLVNDAVYIAKYKDGDWTATGTQFQVPYVFKTLFSKEPIEFNDLCETKSVTTSLYLDLNEELPDVSGLEKELAKAESDHKKGVIKDNVFEKLKTDLYSKIEKGHNYKFVGQIGQFCPIIPGNGGGILVREKDGKYYSVTGTKGYRWLESETVKALDKEHCIDRSYYESLVDDAIKAISKYGDFESFTSSSIDILKKSKFPCGENKYKTCYDCPNFYEDKFHADCNLGYDISNFIVLNNN